ncbi:sigma-E factor regulatory protein RseB [Serratia rhizosphaerae]|uniref:sigma-E factor regulatory protein RseB n=1 Tax=unclassified Serratia (in: enterobacteria) TaxID=2647522 RepID=UPI000CF64ED7|nr:MULTISPECIES: sigma-E factor regulatory protein RseB [unclassified Serratia (in: enterobacteria)]MBU3891730.1 sigma-E factor regulatory protein RseB [Serratia rubidaea]AVJ18895.1 sigma-E factor regulatory protein RseB [Serratia sp. MYb239]MCA4825218.1 sigma-E factor regulatory protein RseB [Serratia rubidaea]QNK33599.1 sigma-E factor regulatory protein RseB [Serratia sp. JUb9]QPT12453.1 sigma-E factor regulatory protein RseB [Serratia rubidaea]
MKQLWFSVCLLTGSLLYSNIAPAQTASGALLQQMSSASRSLNYELAYISITKQGIESLRYRHALVEQQALGQLLHMDGPRREVLQRGDGISYFEPGLEPFTLSGDHIVDALPSIVYADFTRLAKYYDFISVGRTRISDRPCEVIRVVARDGSRYSYIVWMDEETKLPLRVDLLDRNGETLEQYRVISFEVGEEVQNALSGLLKASLPPLISLPAMDNVKLGWNTAWLPAGVSEVARNRRKLPNVSVPVETRLYSDGLFSFSVNVSPAGSGVGTQLYRQGRRTIQTELRNGKEITIVGELPPSTAKRIADGISFRGSSK